MSAEPGHPAVVERDEIAVVGRRVPDDVGQMQRGWAEVEAAIGSLRGRRCYGAFDPVSGSYLVSVQRREDDDPAGLGLEPSTLPGGRYLRVRLHGDPDAVYAAIAPTFARMATLAEQDPTRPLIEHYRRHGEVELLQPVA
jgi:hypothetical protein